HEPGEAAVVEVDHAHVAVVDEQVGEADVGVHEAEALLRLPVLAQAAFDLGVEAVELAALLGAHAEAVLPAPPVAARAERVLVVPGGSIEAGRRAPRASVRMHASRQCTEGPETRDDVVA